VRSVLFFCYTHKSFLSRLAHFRKNRKLQQRNFSMRPYLSVRHRVRCFQSLFYFLSVLFSQALEGGVRPFIFRLLFFFFHIGSWPVLIPLRPPPPPPCVCVCVCVFGWEGVWRDDRHVPSNFFTQLRIQFSGKHQNSATLPPCGVPTVTFCHNKRLLLCPQTVTFCPKRLLFVSQTVTFCVPNGYFCRNKRLLLSQTVTFCPKWLLLSQTVTFCPNGYCLRAVICVRLFFFWKRKKGGP